MQILLSVVDQVVNDALGHKKIWFMHGLTGPDIMNCLIVFATCTTHLRSVDKEDHGKKEEEDDIFCNLPVDCLGFAVVSDTIDDAHVSEITSLMDRLWTERIKENQVCEGKSSGGRQWGQ